MAAVYDFVQDFSVRFGPLAPKVHEHSAYLHEVNSR